MNTVDYLKKKKIKKDKRQEIGTKICPNEINKN